MRWDGGTLRVICLVVSAVSAGYLWRAALEGDAELGRLLDTSSPATIRPSASPPAFAGPIHARPSPDRALAAERRGVARADSAPSKPTRSKPIARRQKRTKAVLVVKRRVAAPPKRRPAPSTRASAAPSPAATAPKKQPTRPKAAPGAAGKTSVPKSPRTPREQPSGGKSDRPGGSAAPPKETPAARPPESAPADPPAPVEPPVSVPMPEPEPTAPTRQAPVRPGWGHGDEKHAHSGPPGKRKKK